MVGGEVGEEERRRGRMEVMRWKSEKELQTWLTGQVKAGGLLVDGSYAVEVKLIKGRCRAGRHLKGLGCKAGLGIGEHEAGQIVELLRASGEVEGACVHKISDESRNRKPWDMFILRGGLQAVMVVGGVCEGCGWWGVWKVGTRVMARFMQEGGKKLTREVLERLGERIAGKG